MMDQPLIESGSEMSTCLGHSTEGDELPALHPPSRARYISFDNDNSKKQKARKENWNSWTGKASSRDSRHFGDDVHNQTMGMAAGSSNSIQPMKPYTRSESGTLEVDVMDVPTSRTSSFTSNATSEGIIDGEFVSSVHDTNEFEQVCNSLRHKNEPSTTKSLNFCKKHNLRHYHNLLKVIGWRKFRDRLDYTPWYLALLNCVYPIFIFLMLILACASQLIACFGRDTSLAPIHIGNSAYQLLSCENHVVTSGTISYLLILLAYLGGFYIFRRSESEHLSSLTETVFLSFNYTSMQKSRKRPAFVLMVFLICGLIWLIFSFGISILRLFALDLNKSTTLIEWFVNKNMTTNSGLNTTNPIIINNESYEILHYFFVSSSILGFIFFDLLYIAVTINFCSQCQLLTYYVENIIDKVQNKQYKSMHSICQEIYHVYEFLKVLNSKVSCLMSLIGLIYVANVINSYRHLRDTDYGDKENIVLGFMNLIQWVSITAFPLIVATQFTAAGTGLRRLGLQIASRPFVYRETSDLDLQYFLNFTESTRFTARIAFVPMYPAFVMGFVFVLVLLLTIGIVIPRIESVPWL